MFGESGSQVWPPSEADSWRALGPRDAASLPGRLRGPAQPPARPRARGSGFLLKLHLPLERPVFPGWSPHSSLLRWAMVPIPQGPKCRLREDHPSFGTKCPLPPPCVRFRHPDLPSLQPRPPPCSPLGKWMPVLLAPQATGCYPWFLPVLPPSAISSSFSPPLSTSGTYPPSPSPSHRRHPGPCPHQWSPDSSPHFCSSLLLISTL